MQSCLHLPMVFRSVEQIVMVFVGDSHSPLFRPSHFPVQSAPCKASGSALGEPEGTLVY